jgi:DNA polymerase-1
MVVHLAGLAIAPDGTCAVADSGGGRLLASADMARTDEADRPRWVTWSGETARQLAVAGVRLRTCWDVATVHRLLFGGWRADPGWAWAHLRGLPLDKVATERPGAPVMADLFDAAAESAATAGAADAGSDAGSLDDGGPLDDGGYLRAGWARGGWAETPGRLLRWAELAREVAELQCAAIARRGDGPVSVATARSESTAELLCAELSVDGLPMDRAVVMRMLAGIIGPRLHDEGKAAAARAARDAVVLRHAPSGVTADLRSPVQVRELLASAGIEVPDTRAWRLEQFRESSPLVAALLEWRKAERIATTYGYSWLDEHLGADGRLRGTWTGSDGGAGRMTASGGLHSMPSAMRRAVIAADGFAFVRADLGQIEPRVLAVVSGDPALAGATLADDLYLPVASELAVDRPTAKVAMIAAMYGQTTGHGGAALRRMRTAYPVAMAYLDAADRSARGGRDLRTYGGRRVPMSSGSGDGPARVAARGRYGRNALIQGAAAELFKMWAVTVRARGASLDARIVLCLHDELLVHVPVALADAAARMVGDCLEETARRWAPGGKVRFTADISVVRSWADAKPTHTDGAGSVLPG